MSLRHLRWHFLRNCFRLAISMERRQWRTKIIFSNTWATHEGTSSCNLIQYLRRESAINMTLNQPQWLTKNESLLYSNDEADRHLFTCLDCCCAIRKWMNISEVMQQQGCKYAWQSSFELLRLLDEVLNLFFVSAKSDSVDLRFQNFPSLNITDCFCSEWERLSKNCFSLLFNKRVWQCSLKKENFNHKIENN